MKLYNHINRPFLLGICISLMAFFYGCQKGELYYDSEPHVVQIAFKGSTATALEFVYNGRVVDSTRGQFHSFPNAFQMLIEEGEQKLHVREKGKTDILRTYDIDPKGFTHEFGIFYDNGEIYDAGITYNLMVFAADIGLDFYVDDKLVYQNPYGGATMNPLTIALNKGQERKLTVTRKDEQEVLVSRTITEADADKTLKFYLDAYGLIERMKLPPLKDPKGMTVMLRFLPDVPFGQTTFLGGDVDLVFYTRDKATEAVSDAHLRFTVPTDGSFGTLELPAIDDSKFYTFDIFRKGTNQVAYQSINGSYTVSPGLGKYGIFYFLTDGLSFFVPGERLICIVSPLEEMGGENFDQIFMTPQTTFQINDWIELVE
ncbi:hypothetical protein ACFSR5_18405 [Sphingobacterium suaedae]|uniref:DUF4249 family protein n=2 Tax=Sphingobacterium suaedae TaxID=1686402 RepID=A0ABW5KKZ8_9SPHI